MVQYKSNADVIAGVGVDALATQVYKRLLLLGKERDLFACYHAKENSLDAGDLIEEGLVDPVKLFVKNEPHGRVKVEQGRMRIISSISLIDSLVERMLAGVQNKAEIGDCYNIPSKPGMGLDDDGLRKLAANIASIPNPAEADISGWDWSIQTWELEFDADARVMLCDGTPFYARMLRNRLFCLGLSRFVLSDGSIFDQEVCALMKSGSYLTSSSNSKLRYILAKLVGAEDAMTMGDDCVESFVTDAPAKYAYYGHIVKMYERCESVVEFCSTSFDFVTGMVAPKNSMKMLFAFLNKVPANQVMKEQLLDALDYDLRHAPEARMNAYRVISGAGWPHQNNRE